MESRRKSTLMTDDELAEIQKRAKFKAVSQFDDLARLLSDISIQAKELDMVWKLHEGEDLDIQNLQDQVGNLLTRVTELESWGWYVKAILESPNSKDIDWAILGAPPKPQSSSRD